jgi:hypothetical protein
MHPGYSELEGVFYSVSDMQEKEGKSTPNERRICAFIQSLSRADKRTGGRHSFGCTVYPASFQASQPPFKA